MAANKKPQPDIYLRALHLLDLAPGQCVAFEDSQTGVMAAKRAGLYAVAIPHEMSREHDFSGADALIHGLAGLDDSLLAMLEASAPELPRPPYPV